MYAEADVVAALGYGSIHDMPDSFTPFRNKLEKSEARVRPPVAAPARLAPAAPGLAALKEALVAAGIASDHPVLSTEAADPRAAFHFRGGEREATARVKDWMWDRRCIETYFDIRNGMLGEAYSTKLSPYLAHGCVSARTIHAEVAKYEADRTSNKSTYWVVFELLWRDFFKFQATKHGNRLFRGSGLLPPGDARVPKWVADGEAFSRWSSGTTGWPLVDANMRELAATGFMSNRGRQNVASFLVHELKVDWRKGAALFETLLLDYDVAANYGNWMSVAGLYGGRVNRFNILKQSKDYDSKGDYVRHWCPELKDVQTRHVHAPWTAPGGGVVGYPKPLVSRWTGYPDAGAAAGGGTGGGKGGGGKGKGKGRADGAGGRRDARRAKEQRGM